MNANRGMVEGMFPSDTPFAFHRYGGHEHPTAEWLGAHDAAGRRYLIHTLEPAFVCKVGAEDDGVLSGLAYAADMHRSLYDFIWFDEYPGSKSFERCMLEAEAVLEELDSLVGGA